MKIQHRDLSVISIDKIDLIGVSVAAEGYASDDKLTFGPFEWSGKNLKFRIVHSNNIVKVKQ